MTSTGEDIFWRNARSVTEKIGLPGLDPGHGAAVDIVRWCLLLKTRPTHHRQRFLENAAPALLAYLEKLDACGEAQGWRTLEGRICLRAEILREYGMQPCARPWLAAIWHTLPELASLGQFILDREAEKQDPAPEVVPVTSDTATDAGGDSDKGSGGKAGSATSNKSRPSPRLVFSVVPVAVTKAELKVLELGKGAEDTNIKTDVAPEGPEGISGPTGPKGPRDRK